MSISANGMTVAGTTKDLSMRWRETKEHWRDSKCREFEQRYMIELEASVDRAIPVLLALDKLIRKIRYDCE